MGSKITKREVLERKRRLAFILYVEQGLEQKVIAEITGISENSITAWKRKDGWEEERTLAKAGPERQMRRIMKHYDALLQVIEDRDPPENVPNSKEADILNKLADSAQKLQTELTIGHKTEVGKQFVSFVQQIHGQARAIEVLEIWHDYIMGTA